MTLSCVKQKSTSFSSSHGVVWISVSVISTPNWARAASLLFHASTAAPHLGSQLGFSQQVHHAGLRACASLRSCLPSSVGETRWMKDSRRTASLSSSILRFLAATTIGISFSFSKSSAFTSKPVASSTWGRSLGCKWPTISPFLIKTG